MRNKKKFSQHLYLLPILFVLFFNGIGRDDVPLRKYFLFANDSVFNCIGEIYLTDKKEFIQSCVLIDKRFLLASAHGFYFDSDTLVQDTIEVLTHKYPIQRPAFTYLANSNLFSIVYGAKSYKIKRIVICNGFDNSFHSAGDNDIALIELSVEIEHILPAVLYTDSNELNSRGITCGFGVLSRAKGINLHFVKRKKMAGENMLDSLGGYKIDGKCGLIFADMDHPGLLCCNRMGSPDPLPLEWHSDGGDCGSGLFVLKNNKWKLAGISFGPSYYADMKTYGLKYGSYGFIDGWTRISPFVNWVQSEMKKEN